MASLTGGSNYGSDPELNRRYQLLNAFGIGQTAAAISSGGVTLLGWSDHIDWEIDAVGRDSEVLDTAVYLIGIPIAITPSSGAGSSVPPALTTWELISAKEFGRNGPYDFYLANDWVSFEYRPWEALRLETVDRLTLNFQIALNPGSVRLSLWDWREERWVEQPGLWQGENIINDPAPYLGPDKAVRVRLENSSLNGSRVERVDVTYHGSAP
jgi:hypothetical protein